MPTIYRKCSTQCLDTLKGGDFLEVLVVDGRKMVRFLRYGVNGADLVHKGLVQYQNRVTDCCECGNEPSGLMKELYNLNTYENGYTGLDIVNLCSC
jgi:hypothetical protein